MAAWYHHPTAADAVPDQRTSRRKVTVVWRRLGGDKALPPLFLPRAREFSRFAHGAAAREPYSGTQPITRRNQHDPGRFECRADHGRAGAVQVVTPLLKIAHRRARHSGPLGQLFLGPIDKAARRATLPRRQSVRHGYWAALDDEIQPFRLR